MRNDWLGGTVANRFNAMRAAVPGRRPLGMQFRNGPDEESALVHIYDEIGFFGISAQSFIGELSRVDARNIDVHISSPGGEIFDGIAIMNALRDHPANVTVYVDSLAASIASVIAMAGDRVVMAPHSEMMIHDGLGMCGGNAADMREMADMLDRQSDKIAGIYAERAGGTAKQWRGRMQAETWYSAEEAVAAGLADEVSKRRTPAEEEMAAAYSNAWDLSVFRFAGRNAAPTPAVPVVDDKATPVHHTDTDEETWDAAEVVAGMPNDATVLKATHAWVDPDGDPDAKGSYKFPHHRTDGGPANLPHVRNGLARLSQADIPDADRAAVEAHLRAHLEDADEGEPEDHAEPALLDTWALNTLRDSIIEAADPPTAYDPDAFRAILDHEANNRPAVTASAPAPQPDPGYIDPTVVTRALREAAR